MTVRSMTVTLLVALGCSLLACSSDVDDDSAEQDDDDMEVMSEDVGQSEAAVSKARSCPSGFKGCSNNIWIRATQACVARGRLKATMCKSKGGIMCVRCN